MQKRCTVALKIGHRADVSWSNETDGTSERITLVVTLSLMSSQYDCYSTPSSSPSALNNQVLCGFLKTQLTHRHAQRVDCCSHRLSL